jgi:5-methylthioribose kinase
MPNKGQGQRVEDIFAVETEGYRPLDAPALAEYLAAIPGMAERLGGAAADWQAREIGDGNLNLVFIVEGPDGAVVVKQALPYLRLAGEGWQLPLERSYFESLALREQQAAVPGMTPRLLATDRVGAAIVMEYLTPHVILRKALIRGHYLPGFADDMANFLAQSLFRTSDFHLSADRKKTLMREFCGNVALCKITEDLVFTDPYRVAEGNRWTSPQLDPDAAALRADARLKAEVQGLKLKFLTHAEALIHGDLHTGSIMATETDTRAIDPEFAFFGPMGFDVGALIGNLLIAAIAHPYHDGTPEGLVYRDWILDQAEHVWAKFDGRFRELWESEGTGDAFTGELFADEAGRAALGIMRDFHMRAVFEDALGFAGCKMIRRVFGLAHVEDLEAIADPDRRAEAERKVVALARRLVLERRRMADFQAVREAFQAAS